MTRTDAKQWWLKKTKVTPGPWRILKSRTGTPNMLVYTPKNFRGIATVVKRIV